MKKKIDTPKVQDCFRMFSGRNDRMTAWHLHRYIHGNWLVSPKPTVMDGVYKFGDAWRVSNIMEYADGKKTFMLVFPGTVEDDNKGTFTWAAAQSIWPWTWGERQKPGIRDESGKEPHRQQRPHHEKIEEKANFTKDGTASNTTFLLPDLIKEEPSVVFAPNYSELKQDDDGKETIELTNVTCMASIWRKTYCQRRKVERWIVKATKWLSPDDNGTPSGLKRTCEDENNLTNLSFSMWKRKRHH